MKSNKFILSLLSVCVAMSALNLSACDETESSSSPSSPTSSSSSSSSSSSNPAEEAVSTTVNETEWNTALSPTAFTNFTATGRETETTAETTTTSSFVAEFATDKLKTTYTEDAFSYTVYTAIENRSVYMYMDMLGNGTYTKSDMGIDASVFPSTAYLSPANELFNFINLYSSFSYNEETLSYTATSIQIDPTLSYANVVLKFEDGVLVSYSATCKVIETDETITTTTTKLTLSKYGTTRVTLPAIENEPSVKGDGIITASEWASAFSASALENVKMSYTMTFSDSTDTMHIYFDDSSIVKINAKFSGYDDENIPYTIITDQYWIENSNQVYVSGIIGDEVIGWTTVSNDRNNYKTAQDCRESLYTFANLYQAFTFNGYEATCDLGNMIITVRFNEQEQLVYYNDGDMISISLSQYGQIHNQLPIEAQ